MACRILKWSAAASLLLSTVSAAPLAGPLAARSPSPTGPSVCGQSSIPVANGNGGFENGLSGWTVSTAPVDGDESSIAVVHPGHNSNSAAEISVGYGASLSLAHIPACEATDYVIQWDYKVLSVTNGAQPHCELYGRAGTDKYNTFSKTIYNLAPGNWTTVAFNYKNDLYAEYAITIGVACDTDGSSAKVLLDNISITAGGSTAAQGCPKQISLDNGGFDNGQLAPWIPNGPQVTKIVSPGYESQHALQIDFSSNPSQTWYATQPMNNELCEGLYYTVSFAVNWLNYTGPASNADNGCSLTVSPGACQYNNNAPYFYATSPGWQQHSFTCQAYGANGPFDVEIDCGSNTPFQPFSVQLDQFTMELDNSTSPSSSSNVSNSVVERSPSHPIRKISLPALPNQPDSIEVRSPSHPIRKISLPGIPGQSGSVEERSLSNPIREISLPGIPGQSESVEARSPSHPIRKISLPALPNQPSDSGSAEKRSPLPPRRKISLPGLPGHSEPVEKRSPLPPRRKISLPALPNQPDSVEERSPPERKISLPALPGQPEQSKKRSPRPPQRKISLPALPNQPSDSESAAK